MLTERMAMRKMNEMCTRMALTLVFYVLLFHNCQGQTDPTLAGPTIQTKGTDPNDFTKVLNEDTSVTNSPISTANQATDHSDPPISNSALPDNNVQQTFTDLFSSAATTSNSVVSTAVTESQSTTESAEELAEESHNSPDNETSYTFGNNLQQTNMDSTTQANVFVPVLVTGLILATLMIGIYGWKNHCHTKKSAMKLAEDSYMADEENQGNTLVSVAPLNPPENQEKPSLNGESLEVVKTQNPPTSTNGHSTAKADTEL
ncbi:uncharacterized protein cd34 isoform X2 [Tachysurus fulvidraco]|uniref:uncharacterized protein cd34 isoform X2 n=1 Tax=Tachysurus fulvidraco TaxID=1234273 RepID=UPI001FEE03DD|nr:uncharacterized protein cd34 isoform X2 [Tachysurus fulvidraco]